ncbi:hypothetical protein G7047_00495 [Diaphorobacter sp. HDW4A]|uniref:hypothetical protein n=1 Tax=Diaphorobacter sp. HDW4A TaxID=2714924 RepID=UPI00140E4120|nr:hypothetical protein [Diaphorobacter sp. HDW4A]QIL78566.1 hypothetical protein G7047_00495 [Diaphorobacter sp. HDW4A]
MSKLHEIVDNKIEEIFEILELIKTVPEYLTQEQFECFMTMLNVLHSLGFIELEFNENGFSVKTIGD